ncbi:MAG TPA: hypothetical protein VGQ12_12720 [Candidatus Angelobacter sp.]|jgi:hypothetical protein|nr:hypothetical protein [Candidatus Angelobacter sp.]
MNARRIALSALVLIAAGFAFAGAANSAPKATAGLRSNMPAGYDVVVLKPSKTILSLIGLIECPELEGAQHVAAGSQKRLVSAGGGTLKEFPQRFSFRITASLRKVFLDGPVTSVTITGDPRELLLNLKFRIRAYNGLEVLEIVPQSVEMIGMPADVPYDERVYRIKVNAGNLPITNRLVVEIFSPHGQLLTHFPFSPL